MGRMAPEKDDEKKGQSATQNVVILGYKTNMHKHNHGVEFKKYDSWTLKEIWNSIIKEMCRLLYADLSIP